MLCSVHGRTDIQNFKCLVQVLGKQTEPDKESAIFSFGQTNRQNFRNTLFNSWAKKQNLRNAILSPMENKQAVAVLTNRHNLARKHPCSKFFIKDDIY